MWVGLLLFDFQSRLILEEKAKLYERLSRDKALLQEDTISEDQSIFLVDFQQKVVENTIKERRSQHSNQKKTPKESSSSDDDEAGEEEYATTNPEEEWYFFYIDYYYYLKLIFNFFFLSGLIMLTLLGELEGASKKISQFFKSKMQK